MTQPDPGSLPALQSNKSILIPDDDVATATAALPAEPEPTPVGPDLWSLAERKVSSMRNSNTTNTPPQPFKRPAGWVDRTGTESDSPTKKIDDDEDSLAKKKLHGKTDFFRLCDLRYRDFERTPVVGLACSSLF